MNFLNDEKKAWGGVGAAHLMLISATFIRVCKHPRLDVSLISAHLRCAHTFPREKSLQSLKAEKSLRQKSHPGTG